MKKAMLWRNMLRPQTLREVPRRDVESLSIISKTHTRKLRSEIRMGEVERSQQNWMIMKIQVTPFPSLTNCQ